MKTLTDGKNSLDVSHLSNSDVNKLVASLATVNSEIWVEGEPRTSALQSSKNGITHTKFYTESHPAGKYANDTYKEIKINPSQKLSHARNENPKDPDLVYEGINFTNWAVKQVSIYELKHGTHKFMAFDPKGYEILQEALKGTKPVNTELDEISRQLRELMHSMDRIKTLLGDVVL